MASVEKAVTALYRDEELAAFAFALTGSVVEAEALLRSSVPPAVARGWWLRRGLASRVRREMVRRAAAPGTGDDADLPDEVIASEVVETVRPPSSPPTSAEPGVNPYAPPADDLGAPPAPPAPAAPPAVPVPQDAAAPAVAPAPEPGTVPASEPPAPASAPADPSPVDVVIADLPPRVRVALALRYRAELDAKATARAMKVSRDEVEGLLDDGRSALAEALGVSAYEVERVMVGEGV
ncbi:hypothetical protein [Demequina sp. NBRC 110057]|uniref:hypothetical protein n=1 Tax=Demequina sp. NBRC 110057 TaxID=1570346 RepID=UPI000A03B0B9|nr:hypothetical protein [Demequina sp. NBRC 110057]